MTTFITNLNFEIINTIGNEEGKNSEVFIVKDHNLNAQFALKKVPKSQLISDFGSDNDNVFFHEARALYQNRHPHVMEIQHASSDEEYIYFSLPFCKNGSLNKLIESRYLTVKEIIKYSLEFLNGLHYIHTNNLIHADIKPTNILLNDNMKAIITDFGLSRYTDNYGVAKYVKFYTCHYPPECIGSQGMTNKADIFQAGLTIYRMCNGNEEFKKQYDFLMSQGPLVLADAIKKEKFPDRDSFLPHIPNKLRRVIKKALKSNPDERYATIIDMMNDIAKIEENLNIRFSVASNVSIWERDNDKGTHVERLSLIEESGVFRTEGYKIRKSDNQKQRITNWTNMGYNNTKEAFKNIEKNLK